MFIIHHFACFFLAVIYFVLFSYVSVICTMHRYTHCLQLLELLLGYVGCSWFAISASTLMSGLSFQFFFFWFLGVLTLLVEIILWGVFGVDLVNLNTKNSLKNPNSDFSSAWSFGNSKINTLLLFYIFVIIFFFLHIILAMEE